MTEHLQRRMAHVRAVTEDSGVHTVTLHLISPNVVDDYGTVWDAHCFDEDLQQRLPALTWAHNWSEPIGRGVDFRLSDEGPDVIFEFDNFEDVPMARRAFSQVRSGTITDCSVGFYYLQRNDPTAAQVEQFPGINEFVVKAGLDETALVLRGAVPKSKVLALRSAGGTVEEELVVALGRKVAAGEITEAEAKAALRLAAEDDPSSGTEGQALPDPEQTEKERVELEQLVNEAIDTIEGHGL